MLMGTAVRRASDEDIAVLSTVVADALMAGPVGAWLVPDAAERPKVVRRYADLVVRDGVEYGLVDTVDDHAAVAVWYHRRCRRHHDPRDAAGITSPSARWHGLHRRLGPYADRFALLHAYVDEALPHTPHHYLAHLAVGPGQDAAASVLLTSHHDVLDVDGLPAYAEVSSASPGESMLARLGYQPRSPILLEPGGPMLWRMVRPAPGRSLPSVLPRRVRLHRFATPFRGRVMLAASPGSP